MLCYHIKLSNVTKCTTFNYDVVMCNKSYNADMIWYRMYNII